MMKTSDEILQTNRKVARVSAKFAFVCGLLAMGANVMQWFSGDHRINIIGLSVLVGISPYLILGKYVMVKSPQEWPSWARAYFWSAIWISLFVSLVVMAQLCGFIKLPYISP